ncbi:hypothetical protein ACFL5G_01275 [Candidatus Margulisiibacteriota bacterium]
MKNKIRKECLIIGLIGLMILSGGCGTAGNAVAKIEAPDRVGSLEATATPDQSKITTTNNISPTEDTVQGTAGAVVANATIKVYESFAGEAPLYTGTANADGSFSVNIGDGVMITVYVTATAAGKGESEEVALIL